MLMNKIMIVVLSSYSRCKFMPPVAAIKQDTKVFTNTKFKFGTKISPCINGSMTNKVDFSALSLDKLELNNFWFQFWYWVENFRIFKEIRLKI